MSLEDTIRRIASKALEANEETVKFRIVAPILEGLGWDVQDRDSGKGHEDVHFEVTIADERADIGLMSGKKCVAIVEVKRTSETLGGEKKRRQIASYAFGSTAHIFALTNGKQWWIYYMRSDLDLEDRRFAALDLVSDNPKYLVKELNAFLSKPKLLDGSAVREAKKRLRENQEKQELANRIDEVWKPYYNAMLVESDSKFSDVVDYVLQDLGEDSNAMHKTVAKVIRETHGIPKNTSSTKANSLKSKTVKPISKVKNKSAKPGYIFVLEQRYNVKTYVDILFATALALYGKFGSRLLDMVSEGYENSHNLIAITKVGEHFKKRDNVPYWVQTHGNAVTVLWKARKLLECTGESKVSLRIYDTEGNEIEEKGSLVLRKK